jgi:hypothetical protein
MLQPFENTQRRHWNGSRCVAMKSKTSVFARSRSDQGTLNFCDVSEELSRSEGAAGVLGCCMCEEFGTQEHPSLSSTAQQSCT